jgi:hypothetical protein
MWKTYQKIQEKDILNRSLSGMVGKVEEKFKFLMEKSQKINLLINNEE